MLIGVVTTWEMRVHLHPVVTLQIGLKKTVPWQQEEEQQLTWKAISAIDGEGLARACLAISKDADIVAIHS